MLPARILIAALFACTLAAQSEFNGRWVIESESGGQHVYWLEVRGAGTGRMEGAFYGATGGRLAPILDARVDGAVLLFRVERYFDTPANAHWNRARVEARIEQGKLRGSLIRETSRVSWHGWRSLELSGRDDGTWRNAAAFDLLRERDLAAWHVESLRPGRGWSFDGKVLSSVGTSDNLISRERFQNFALHAEFRLPQTMNSGISLRGRYELQLLGDFGQAPDAHGNGAIYSRIRPSVNASRPGNEWQTLDVRLIGREVTVVLNALKIIDRQRIEGPCGLALDAHED